MTRQESKTGGLPAASSAQKPERADPDAIIRGIAARQHGVVTRHELVDAGVAPHRIDHRLKRGRLTPLHRGVYRVGPVAAPYQREAAALLACGSAAILSHLSAAVLWDFAERKAPRGAAASHAGEPRVDVSVYRGRARPHRVRVHRVRPPGEDEVTVREGLAVTVPARTLLDLAPVVAGRDLEQMLARALRSGVADEATIHRLIGRYPRRPGTGRLRALLAAEAPPAFTRSEAERVLHDLMSRAGRPPPRTNTRLAGFEVDAYWPRQKLVVEVDGYAFHSGRRAFESDRRRDAALQAKGIRVLRVTWTRLKAEPEAVLADIVEALATRHS